MLLCASNVVVSVVATAFRSEKAGLYNEAAAACNAKGRDTRSQSDRDDWLKRELTLDEKLYKTLTATQSFEAAVILLMAFGFLLFFPACIVMFRRVESRLDSIMQEYSHRSDLGTVFLPREFSPAAADGEQIQLEMQVVEARAFLDRMKSAAAVQRMRFLSCLVLVMITLLLQGLDNVFYTIVVNATKDDDCNMCESCQMVLHLIGIWYKESPEVFPLVSSACTLPLTFSLWLMTTKEDRALMLNPGRFRTNSIALEPVAGEVTARLKTERVRMGIDLL
jgi:hypothetical protein